MIFKTLAGGGNAIQKSKKEKDIQLRAALLALLAFWGFFSLTGRVGNGDIDARGVPTHRPFP
jgi:hypothetical protein